VKTQLIILCTLAAVYSAARAQTPAAVVPFEIKGMRVGTHPQVYVDEAWKKNAPVIEAQLRTIEDLQGKKPFVKAYFYDKDKKLIVKADRPSEYTEPGKGSIRIPDYLKPKETYKVCFGITAQALDVHHKWSRVLVVFGEGNRATAEVYPPDDIGSFEFDEKAFTTVKKK
jgi:hypothetical protein